VAEEESKEQTQENTEESPLAETGEVHGWLKENGFETELMEPDHLGIEVIKVQPEVLIPVATALYAYGFNYLQCQGGYDVGPGEELVSFYHLTKISDDAEQPEEVRVKVFLIKISDDAEQPEEVRVKVFLPRENPTMPSVYWIWKSADWQERETYDMFGIVYEGHPNLKRILMPEDWVGWPLRKDYISPDFYELQDAY